MPRLAPASPAVFPSREKGFAGFILLRLAWWHATLLHRLRARRRDRPGGCAGREEGARSGWGALWGAFRVRRLWMGFGLLLQPRGDDAHGRAGAAAGARRNPAGRGGPSRHTRPHYAERAAAADPPRLRPVCQCSARIPV